MEQEEQEEKQEEQEEEQEEQEREEQEQEGQEQKEQEQEEQDEQEQKEEEEQKDEQEELEEREISESNNRTVFELHGKSADSSALARRYIEGEDVELPADAAASQPLFVRAEVIELVRQPIAKQTIRRNRNMQEEGWHFSCGRGCTRDGS